MDAATAGKRHATPTGFAAPPYSLAVFIRYENPKETK
jgi:hypothetical protein